MIQISQKIQRTTATTRHWITFVTVATSKIVICCSQRCYLRGKIGLACSFVSLVAPNMTFSACLGEELVKFRILHVVMRCTYVRFTGKYHCYLRLVVAILLIQLQFDGFFCTMPQLEVIRVASSYHQGNSNISAKNEAICDNFRNRYYKLIGIFALASLSPQSVQSKHRHGF